MEELHLLQSQGFSVFKTLGQGAFGKVFLVYHVETGLIAAKVMRKQVFDQKEWAAAAYFEKEPVPFVVQFKLAKQFDDLVVILLEFANMKSLDPIVKKNIDLTAGTLRAVAKQLFEGLRLIHSKGLVHRDIKCENILLHCPFGSNRVIVKIADFGLVKFQEMLNNTILMSAKGTPLNMAPELVNGDGKADAKVDVWSMGVVIFQLAGHEYPIKAMGIPDLQKLMKLRTITRPSAITDDLLWDLLIHLLDFDRKTRFSAAEALQHPYFTGPQAQIEISAEAKQVAASALQAQQNGDTSITIYDINPSFTVCKSEIKSALNYNPDVDLQGVYNQIQQQQQQIYPSQQQPIQQKGKGNPFQQVAANANDLRNEIQSVHSEDDNCAEIQIECPFCNQQIAPLRMREHIKDSHNQFLVAFDEAKNLAQNINENDQQDNNLDEGDISWVKFKNGINPVRCPLCPPQSQTMSNREFIQHITEYDIKKRELIRIIVRLQQLIQNIQGNQQQGRGNKSIFGQIVAFSLKTAKVIGKGLLHTDVTLAITARASLVLAFAAYFTRICVISAPFCIACFTLEFATICAYHATSWAVHVFLNAIFTEVLFAFLAGSKTTLACLFVTNATFDYRVQTFFADFLQASCALFGTFYANIFTTFSTINSLLKAILTEFLIAFFTFCSATLACLFVACITIDSRIKTFFAYFLLACCALFGTFFTNIFIASMTIYSLLQAILAKFLITFLALSNATLACLFVAYTTLDFRIQTFFAHFTLACCALLRTFYTNNTTTLITINSIFNAFLTEVLFALLARSNATLT
ncbi:MAG: putative Protein kinase domain containing protein [Streblomastix strix]|uniref:Protein kinase domain-containing protein n=1 Tax=Streblomastix strix TaxID=222440 RepID=A0A5J4WVZ2_9EUKA|nr:MAG: putative Protein kinase domain containing protein [Streblomastix strix]